MFGANDTLRSYPLFFDPGAPACFADRLATAGGDDPGPAAGRGRGREDAMIDYWDPFLNFTDTVEVPGSGRCR